MLGYFAIRRRNATVWRRLYTKGLTREQAGDVFDGICGEHYPKSGISRMVGCVRTQVSEWLEPGA